MQAALRPQTLSITSDSSTKQPSCNSLYSLVCRKGTWLRENQASRPNSLAKVSRFDLRATDHQGQSPTELKRSAHSRRNSLTMDGMTTSTLHGAFSSAVHFISGILRRTLGEADR